MFLRRRRSAEEIKLLDQLRDLEPEIRLHLSRIFPDVAQATPLDLQLLQVDCAHWMVVASTRTRPARRLLVKGPRKYGPSPAKLEMERHLLAGIVPQIIAGNPLTRSPQLLASYPDRQLLLLEMVEGVHLYSMLFGLRDLGARRRLPDLISLCAEWLARFHRLTESGETGNPFDWLIEELERPRAQDVLERYAGPETRAALCELAHWARDRYPDFRRPLCLLHRRFAPYHVLVQGRRIYVFDLETNPAHGYPYEDLAHFTTYADIVFPWRYAAGIMRMNLAEQRRTFLEAYVRHTSPLTEPEQAVLRFARVLAMVSYASDLEKEDTGKRRLRGWVGKPWYRHRFRLVCREELAALREMASSPAGGGAP